MLVVFWSVSFDLDPDLRIRFVKNRIRLRNQLLKKEIFYKKYNTQNYDFFLLFMSLLFRLFMCNKQKRDFFINEIWCNFGRFYVNFSWFFASWIRILKRIQIRRNETDPTPVVGNNYSRCIFSVLLRWANAIKVWANAIKMPY